MHVTDDFRLNETHTSPKGSKFKIQSDGRLYFIHMENGGVRPDICNVKFTSYKKAKDELDRYFRNNPKPVPREKSRAKEE